MNDRRRTHDRIGGDAFDDERFWQAAEQWIDRLEQASKSIDPRSETSLNRFYQDIVMGLRQATESDVVRLLVCEDDARHSIAEEGMAIHDEPGEASGDLITVMETVLDQICLELEVKFVRPIAIPRRRATEQLMTALADLASPVLLKSKFALTADRLQTQDRRDAFMARLYQGADLTETFASISAAFSRETSIDRVSLLRFQSDRYRWVASSTQPRVDRRATQVRLLESLTKRCLEDSKQLSYRIGESAATDDRWNAELHRYLDEAGCREIYIEAVMDEDIVTPIAAIVLEQFAWQENAPENLQTPWLQFREVVNEAIVQTVHRDERMLSSVFGRFRDSVAQGRLAAALGALMLLMILAWIPVSFAIPAEGRIVAADQAQLFSPADGQVVEVLVKDGESVQSGQPLVILRSPELDIKRQALLAALETSRVKLDSLAVRRSADRDTSSSADEQVLQTEIVGLGRQLDLINSQLAELTLKSPIDGVVDRWDLAMALDARPVRLGQHLLSIVSSSSEWTADLEVADQSIGYLLQAQTEQPLTCSVRLRSHPTEAFTGYVSLISGVADLNESGESVVHVAVPLDGAGDQVMRQGSTVISKIDCGSRSAGFVYLRSVIEWYRRQSWL